MSTELVIIEELEKPKVFAPKGLDPILKRIDKQARSILLDPTTKAGRENIKSVAYKIAQSKTMVLNAGKALTERMRKEIGEINEERDRGVDFLQSLQDELRKPVTEFEQKEKDRVAAHDAAIQKMNELTMFNSLVPLTSALVHERIDSMNALVDRDWEEFDERAKIEYDKATTLLADAFHNALKAEKEQKELAKLRAAEEKRKQEEREDEIRKQAQEDAAAAEKKKRDKLEADLKAEKEKNERLEQKRKDDAKKAEQDKERAIQSEKDRVERERKAAAEAEAKREANKKHCAKINNEALEVLATLCGPKEAKAIVIAIAEGKVPHVSIQY